MSKFPAQAWQLFLRFMLYMKSVFKLFEEIPAQISFIKAQEQSSLLVVWQLWAQDCRLEIVLTFIGSITQNTSA